MYDPAHPASELDTRPLTGALGAEIYGVDLAQLSDTQFQALHRDFLHYGVLAIRNQTLTPPQLLELAERFGSAEIHPIVQGLPELPQVIKIHKAAGDPATFGIGWHSDNSFTTQPSLCSLVLASTVPPVGGDTLFANQYLAFDQLSSGLQDMLRGLRAVHSARNAYTAPTTTDKYEGKTTMAYSRSEIIEAEVLHPIVRQHPQTGRESLFINPMFTLKFENMSEDESRPLLDYLFRHSTREDFQCRVRWQPDTLTIWDNRCVQHSALNDCQGHERILYRVTVAGDQPVGRQ